MQSSLLIARIVLHPGGGRPPFRRGDCNDDGTADLSDALCALGWLFLGDPAPPCLAALNLNGDTVIGLSDSVPLLYYLFLGTEPPAEPFPSCRWSDRVEDLELGCEASSCP